MADENERDDLKNRIVQRMHELDALDDLPATVEEIAVGVAAAAPVHVALTALVLEDHVVAVPADSGLVYALSSPSA